MANMIRDYKSSGISKGDQDISPEGNWIWILYSSSVASMTPHLMVTASFYFQCSL
jgi:hypothetical protein